MDMDNQVSYVVNLPTLIDKVFQLFYFLFFLFILNLQLYSDIVKLQGGTYSVFVQNNNVQQGKILQYNADSRLYRRLAVKNMVRFSKQVFKGTQLVFIFNLFLNLLRLIEKYSAFWKDVCKTVWNVFENFTQRTQYRWGWSQFQLYYGQIVVAKCCVSFKIKLYILSHNETFKLRYHIFVSMVWLMGCY